MKGSVDEHRTLLRTANAEPRQDEFGETPNEIIRQATERFAAEISSIMHSAAVAQTRLQKSKNRKKRKS